MRNPFKKKALTGTPAVLDALRDGRWEPWPLLGGGSRQRIQDVYNTAQSATYAWTYTNSPAVRTVVDVLVRNIGQLDLRLYEEISEDERHPAPDHPAALSLRYPNEETSADSFVRSLLKDFLIYDNAYAVMAEAPGTRIMFNWVPAHMVEVRGASLFRAEGYRVHRRDGTFVDFPPANVMHWRGENPNDPRVGLSRLDTLRSVIAEDAALQQAIVELANSGLTEPLWAFRPMEAPELSPEARIGLEEDLANRLRARNRRPMVMEEGTELRSFGVNPRDAQMFEIRRSATERIAAIYGVPLGMVGLEANVVDAQKQFYSDTLPPYCEEFTKMLNQRILVRVYDWTQGCFEFNLDEKLMGDDRIKTLVSASGRAVMTTDEARAKLNLAPIDGGDELVTPLNVMVGDNPKPSPAVSPPQDPNAPSQEGDARNPQELPPANRRALEPAGKAEEYERLPQLHPSFKDDQDRQFRAIDQAQALIQRHLNRLFRSLKARAAEKADPAAATDWERWDRELARDIHKLASQTVETEGTIYAFKLAGSFDMAQVQNYVRALSEGAAAAFNDKIHEEVDRLGLDGAQARQGAHVESAGAGLGAGVTMWARDEAARQSPFPERRMKVWIPDTERHAEFAGDTVALGEDWPAGFAPGTAPNCRCSFAIR